MTEMPRCRFIMPPRDARAVWLVKAGSGTAHQNHLGRAARVERHQAGVNRAIRVAGLHIELCRLLVAADHRGDPAATRQLTLGESLAERDPWSVAGRTFRQQSHTDDITAATR